MATRFKKASVAEQGTVLTWTFTNGKVLTLDVGKLPTELQLKAAVHGIRQKGSDCYAGAETADEAYESCREVMATLDAGEWNTRREGGERTPALFNEAIERYIVANPAKEQAIRNGLANGANVMNKATGTSEFVDADTFKKKLRDAPAIQGLIATIQKERADAKASESADKDVDALLAV